MTEYTNTIKATNIKANETTSNDINVSSHTGTSGGVGGAITLTSGDGGSVNSGTAGVGGGISLLAGNGGTFVSGTGSAGGDILSEAGDTSTNGSNTNAGNLTMETGRSNGIGYALLTLKTPAINTSSATTQNSLVTRRVYGKQVTVSTNVTVTLFTGTLPNNTGAAAEIRYQIFNRNGTSSLQIIYGFYTFSVLRNNTNQLTSTATNATTAPNFQRTVISGTQAITSTPFTIADTVSPGFSVSVTMSINGTTSCYMIWDVTWFGNNDITV